MVLLNSQNTLNLLSRLKLYSEILQNMGPRYLLFRAKYEASRVLGLHSAKFPINPSDQEFVSLEQWRSLDLPWMIQPTDTIGVAKNTTQQLAHRINQLRQGVFVFFNAFELDLGPSPDWHTHPESGFQYDNNLHWTQIQDFSVEAGDIKYLWERARFGFVSDLIRWHHHMGEDTAEEIFVHMESFIEANPINCGANYRCSQEISLRVMHWTFAMHYFKNHPALTEARFSIFMHHIYWQLKHVFDNIDFSRIAVRNNHAITETLMLYLAGLWYPFFPESSLWKKQGKAWLEEEVAYQIYADGTYLQWSMNYHRVVVQLLTLALSAARKAGEGFSETFMSRCFQTLGFLLDCVNESDGHVPNYGSNDGALFFRFADQDYRDYRPQLNALHVALYGQHVFTSDSNIEAASWFGLQAEGVANWNALGSKSFGLGGFYWFKETDSFTFLRCAGYKDRPAQADNLHLDIWANGHNILRDAGSYKYNTAPELTRFFAGTAGHNTVMLGDFDQMQKGPRFVWLKWNQVLKTHVSETDEVWIFEGSIAAFAHVQPGIVHTRKVTKWKKIHRWHIEDTLENAPAHLPIHQIWNPHPDFRSNLVFTAEDDYLNPLQPVEKSGWYSGYYGVKEPTTQVVVSSKTHSISTTITLL